MEEYNLNFYEAIEKCLFDDYYIVGEEFEKGTYAKNLDEVIVLYEIDSDNKMFQHPVCNLMISKGLLKQRFKTIVVANAQTLGLE